MPVDPPPSYIAEVTWVSPVVYGAVLLGGLAFSVVGEEAQPPGAIAGFAAALAALILLDLAERRRYPHRTPRGPAAALLLARLALFVVVVACDGSGLGRVLFVLLPFTAYFAFGRAVAIGLAAGCLALLVGWFTLTEPGWYADAEYASDALMFAIGLVLALSMAAVAVEEQRGRARLAAYAAQVAELSTAMERTRVARDLHDSAGHHLTAISVQLEKAAAFRDRDPAAADRALSDARLSAKRALDEIRASVRALRSPPTPLEPLLADLARRAADDRFAVTLHVEGDDPSHGEAARTALYRAVQEGITNARRHGQATRVDITVTYDPAGTTLLLADNGVGPRGSGPGGLGLLGMRERVQALGGRVSLGRGAQGGAVLTVFLPALVPA